MGLISELKRRNVLRMGVLYLGAAWVVLQVVDLLIDRGPLPEALGPVALTVLAIGFPIALVLSWFYEVRPESISRTQDVKPSASGFAPARRIEFIIIAVMGAALLLLAYDKWWTGPPPVQSVAVLPFANMSGDSEQEYFSDGLTETVLQSLAQLHGLKVSARTSAFFFKGQNVDTREVAQKLGVSSILKGSVQRDGDRIRVVAQLIEAKSGFHLWSNSYDRELKDIFDIQDDIASNVADALQVTLLGATPRPDQVSLTTKSSQAYEKYLQALEQKNIASYGSLTIAEGLFKEALSLDPGFREATIELAKTYELQQEIGILTYAGAEARIRPLLDQALRQYPDDGRAIGMLAIYDWPRARLSYGESSNQVSLVEAELKRAIDLAPNDPDLYAFMASIASSTNRIEESLNWIDKGLAVDPLSTRLHLNRGGKLLWLLDRPEEAAKSFSKAHEILPQHTGATLALGDAAIAMGKFAEGVGWYLYSMSLDPQDHEIPVTMSRIYYQLGMQEEGDDMLRLAQALAPEKGITKRAQLERHLYAGNIERAVVLAETMIRDAIENRRGTFDAAVSAYVSSMIELGRSDQVSVFFESVRPGITSDGYEPRAPIDSSMQFFLVMALLDRGEFELANAKLDKVIAIADAVVPGWRSNHDTMAVVSIARGDHEAAIEHALKDMKHPLGRRANWRIVYQHMSWMKPLLSDERIVARISELESLTQKAAEEVRGMPVSQYP
jgi:TolB-like protein